MIQATKLLVTLFFCVTFSVLGQNCKSRIGFKLLPGLTNIYDPLEEQNFQNNLHPRFTFNFGANYIREIKDSLLFLETGIYYADRGALQKDFVAIYNTSQGPLTTTSDIYVHNYFVSIPLLFRIERKFFYASIGGSIDYFTHVKRVWTPEESKIEKSNWRPDGFSNSFKFAASLSIGAQINLTNQLGLFVEGNFNPSGLYKDKVNNKYSFFWNYLIGTGLAYRF
ncbi:MAG: hypothetical protein IPO32_06180 [Crocinitomicaceae bacterium]|nr:hypothetical protein [Crocinitomicaceae bacterium]